MTPHYHINVFWSDDDRCWIANVPDLHPCSAHGATPTEAVAEIEVVIDSWLDVARDRGFPIPEPSYRSSSQRD
jgi:predicted RNase H-like HicB family nuclease